MKEIETKRPTLKTISNVTGLAIPTISRALSDAPDISAETKILVKKTAEELGYHPNRAGLRLRTGRTNVISLVLAPEKSVVNQMTAMIQGIGNGLEGTNFHLNMMPFSQGDGLKPIKYIVETGAADAVIFNQTEPEDARVKYLMERKFPFVTHGRTKWQEKHAYFDYDNATFASRAVEALARRGRKRILMIAPLRNQRYAIDMLQGAADAAAALGVELDAPEEINSDLPLDVIREALIVYLKENPGFDGVATGTINSAVAALAAFLHAGRKTGEDIDLAAKEPGGPFLEHFDRNVIVFQENIGRAGEFMAKAAIEAINNPDNPPMQYLDQS